MWLAIRICLFEEPKENFQLFDVPKVIKEITKRANLEAVADECSGCVLSHAVLQFPALTGITAIILLILSPYLEASGVNTEWLGLAPNVFCSLVWSYHNFNSKDMSSLLS